MLSYSKNRTPSFRSRFAHHAHTKLMRLLAAAGIVQCLLSYSATVSNAKLDTIETTVSTAPELRIYNGTIPATADTALAGNTLLASGALPSDWLAAASGNSKAKAGTWTLTGQSGAGAGTAGTFFRIYQSTTCHMQGSLGAATVIATSALTAANGNLLTFAATTGVAVGQKVTGTGILADTVVIAFTGTTVTLSKSSTAGVSNATNITFGYDMVLDNNNIANAQSVTVSTFTIAGAN